MRTLLSISLALFCLVFMTLQCALSQSYNVSLTMQGLNHGGEASAISRALGSTTLASKNDIGVMFSNPAALQTIDGIQVSIGGLQQYKTNEQTQQWYANQWYTNFSLLMEGLTSGIIIDTIRVTGLRNAGDTIPRPYDNLTPNWQNKKNQILPIQAMMAVPMTIESIKFTVGVGSVEYANLNYFYQNNNTLNPDIQYIKKPQIDVLTTSVNWSQVRRYRDGSIFGYGGALAASVRENISLGASVLYLKGSTNDYDYIQDRGRLRFAQTYFRLTPTPYTYSSTGTSDFTGFDYTFSGSYNTKNIIFGFSLKPPTTISRDYKATIVNDTAGVKTTSNVSGSDKMKLPLRWTIGIGFTLRQQITASVEYQSSAMASAQFSANGKTTNPWLNGSTFRFGMEYMPISWLAVRGGYQIQSEVFQPQSYGLRGDAVTYAIYSVGLGARILPSLRVNIAYEYIQIKYEDAWSTNANINTELRQNIIGSISYDLGSLNGFIL